MKNRMLVALSAAAAAAFLCLSARAEIAEEPLVNPADETDVWGKKITGLGENGDETALVFTKTGETLNWTLEKGVNSIWYLVAGGGGSGGASSGNKYYCSGGGGAGGLLESKDVEISSQQIAVLVGAGGDAVVAVGTSAGESGKNGGNSELRIGSDDPVVAYGGGGGSKANSPGGADGGSGGGAGAGWGTNDKNKDYPYGQGVDGQGNNGGTAKRQAGAGGGGGAGGKGESTSSGSTVLKTAGGAGGAGKSSVILGNETWYCAGGGGGGYTGSGGAGGSGVGGAGSKQTKTKNTVAGSGTTYGCGGGGTCGLPDTDTTQTHTSGAGYQGVVIVRYKVLAADVVEEPTIAGVDYNGMLQKAVVPASDGYTVTKNDGGVDAGDYDVVLTLVGDYKWYDGSTEPKTLTFTIAKIANGWVTQPSLSKTVWELAEDPATVNAGAALSETDVVVTYDEGEDVMPLTIGTHKAVFTVEVSQNYLGLSKTINYTINKNANSWTVEPSLTKTTWTVGDEPGVIVAGAAKYGEIVVTYDNDPVLTELPTSAGKHTVVFSVAEDETYTALSKLVEYTVMKVPNAWLIEPGLTKTAWAFDEVPGEIVDGEAKYGDVVVTYDDDPSLVDLPTELGSHTVKFAVAETDTCMGLEKVVNYTVTKKQHKWTVPPKVSATVNIEDGVSFPMPAAEPDVKVSAYFDGDPEKTELTEIAVGETHTVTYAIAGDDDWDEVKQTFTFKVVYKAIVDRVDPSKVYGYRIPKLGANHDEVALVFTNTGYTAANSMRWTLPQEVTAIDYLVVGGGGGGGGWTGSYAAGGGGAGGVVSNNNVAVSGALSIVVGNGGAGCTSKPYNNKSGDHSLLVIGDAQPVTAYGGGKGGCAAAGTGGEGFGSGGGGGSTASGGKYVGFAGGAAGQGFAGGAGGNTTYRGGGGGGAGEPGQTPTSTNSGKGGDGVASDITGQETWYAGGGGAGSQTNNGGIASPGGKGGGGAGGACASNQQTAGRNATYFGGGGGSAKGDANGGSGYQGVVIVRYVEPKGVVMVPYIAPKAYTGETLVADVPANVGYTVTENAGGTDVGEYTVILTLNDDYHWDGGSTEKTNLVFAITPAQNEWTVDSSITKATWLTTDEPGVLTAGATKFGTPTASITKDGGDAESFDGTLPTEVGRYVIIYTVETSDNWIDPDETEKSVGFEIVSGDVVPPFTVTKGETATIVGDDKVDLSVGYAVHCEVESDKKVDIYAYIAEDGTDTTNEVKIAVGVALDATGTGVIPDLKPGATYWVALGGKGGDTVAPTTEFTAVTVPGPAKDLVASAKFTTNPNEFVISGSVIPGVGTTKVTVRWSVSSTDLDKSETFAFALGDEGAFVKVIPYANYHDWLQWDVTVENSFGGQEWSSSLPSTKTTRADQSTVTYTWKGADGGSWLEPANWTPSKTPCFGYPDGKFDRVSITKITTINLGGASIDLDTTVNQPTFGLASGKTVTLTNGSVTLPSKQIKTNCHLCLKDGGTVTTEVEETLFAQQTGYNGVLELAGNATVQGGVNTHTYDTEAIKAIGNTILVHGENNKITGSVMNQGGRLLLDVRDGSLDVGGMDIWGAGASPLELSVSNATVKVGSFGLRHAASQTANRRKFDVFVPAGGLAEAPITVSTKYDLTTAAYFELTTDPSFVSGWVPLIKGIRSIPDVETLIAHTTYDTERFSGVKYALRNGVLFVKLKGVGFAVIVK